MDSPEQRRRRKRFLKTKSPSVRSFLYCLSFFVFFYLLLRRNTPAFHPVLVLSSLSLSSSSTYPAESVGAISGFNELTRFKIEDQVQFPDHYLFLLSESNYNRIANELECVYRRNTSDSGDGVTEGRAVLSVDEYDGVLRLVRCPLPPANFSSVVTVRRRGSMVDLNDNKRLNSWENLAYEAVLDGETAIVFVKGISHRQDRESDPAQFRCHFGLGNWETDRDRENRKYVFTTRALTAAQEVVRCALPRSIRLNPNKAAGIRVTVSFTIPRFRRHPPRQVLVPSAAKLTQLANRAGPQKHHLCVCTMLWNQAGSIPEWVRYHSWLGVERWFIYDNNSDDDIKEVVRKLDVDGYNVTRHVWPWIKTQEAGFSHCAIRAREECNWVSFMDVDEFYYLTGNQGSGSLRTLVSNISTDVGEIRTSCHSFGPSGLTTRPNQGVTVGYTCRLQSPERHKSIVRLDALDSTLMNVVHHFHLRKGFGYIDVHQTTAVINHYKYQVWEAFRAKFHRRVATYVADWQDSQNEGSRDRAPGLGTEAIEPPNWRLQFCEVWDTGLRDFVLANLADVSTGVLPWTYGVKQIQ